MAVSQAIAVAHGIHRELVGEALPLEARLLIGDEPSNLEAA